MTKRDKLIERLLEKPADFTWQELDRLLSSFGFKLTNAGKTSGSRVRYIHDDYHSLMLHKPHPKPILKRYQIESIINLLKQEGIL